MAITSMQDMEILELDSFEVPYPMSDEEKERYSRRFLTLLIPAGSQPHRGGSGRVYKVMNTEGEVFAMKRIEKPVRTPTMDDKRYARNVAAQVAAFRKEFENQQRLSGFKGFPKLHGYGMAEGEPLIVMEWVEGTTVSKAAELRAADPAGKRVPPLVVAQLGITLFDLIARFDYLDDSFAHRDISPNNIMLRTDTTSLAQQVKTDSYDVCLIDFGSATLLTQHDDPSFTTMTNVLRKATPEYAPPEMLTNDLPGLDRLRKSILIDVYAISGVLYEMLCGETPYRLAKLSYDPDSYYRYKIEHPIPNPVSLHDTMSLSAPMEHEPRLKTVLEHLRAEGNFDERRFRDAVNTVDAQLGHILIKALKPEQQERPSAWEMKDMLERFEKNYADNIARRYHGDHILPFISTDSIPRRPQALPLATPTLPKETTVLRPAVPVSYATIQAIPLSDDSSSSVSAVAVTLCTLLVAGIAVAFSFLVAGSPGTWSILGKTFSGTLPLFLCLVGFLAPPLIALPFYWMGGKSGVHLLAGTVILVCLEACVWIVVHNGVWISSSVEPFVSLGMICVSLATTVAAACIIRAHARRAAEE